MQRFFYLFLAREILFELFLHFIVALEQLDHLDNSIFLLSQLCISNVFHIVSDDLVNLMNRCVSFR